MFFIFAAGRPCEKAAKVGVLLKSATKATRSGLCIHQILYPFVSYDERETAPYLLQIVG
jgi:hypothetical protein